MIGRLLQRFLGISRNTGGFDPSVFGDPIAGQIAWTPVRSGGASFRTHRLVEVAVHRIEFVAAASSKIFSALFILVGVAPLAFFLGRSFARGAIVLDLPSLIFLLAGALFTTVGGLMFRWVTTPVVFDKYQGLFWKGKKSPEGVFPLEAMDNSARLDDIHALQLISEYCRSNDGSYYSYELNVVLKDSRRINVVDHGILAKLREDALTLSQFLGKPIWDAVK